MCSGSPRYCFCRLATTSLFRALSPARFSLALSLLNRQICHRRLGVNCIVTYFFPLLLPILPSSLSPAAQLCRVKEADCHEAGCGAVQALNEDVRSVSPSHLQRCATPCAWDIEKKKDNPPLKNSYWLHFQLARRYLNITTFTDGCGKTAGQGDVYVCVCGGVGGRGALWE